MTATQATTRGTDDMQHTIVLSSASADIARCRWCDEPVVYTEHESWTHEDSDDDATHTVHAVFTVPATGPDHTFDVGDSFVIEALDGTWLGEAYDVAVDGRTAYVEAM